ncbi:hypothetical protein LY90DRAFT_269256 [Neocallimastix californiae]|jgi:hypothetical protein|uniref:F-box domain-containing protein n=1 Tax=Neocallimastix californiae TaxID=1754190 RepID=A0A1Y2FFW2_9FUNG|nr:hypothetical protein LY90DRAFT_269256 [Neocallimastix californiae]|eukprot:ORY82792.1 hypothetical protein LY90DRAFT_269256 [Neocallimastix californiae]
MERKGFFKLPFQILFYEIPKYLELKDYISYISTCKYLKDNLEHSNIWKKELKKKYTEEEILFAQNENSYYEKFKKLATQTINYHDCNVAHRENYWQEKNDGLTLVNVCWLHVIGELENVPDGRYVPEFKVKFAKRPLGLTRLLFKATVYEKRIEPKATPEEDNNNNSQEQEQTTQPRDENEQPTESSSSDASSENVNTVNDSNKRASLFDITLSLLTLGLYKGNSTQSNNTDNRNINNNADNKKSLPSREIMSTENQFKSTTLNLYKNAEWRIVECPEIKVDRSNIDPTNTKIIVKLEIRDTNGYWKNGLSFRGMRLRKVIPSNSDTETSEEE